MVSRVGMIIAATMGVMQQLKTIQQCYFIPVQTSDVHRSDSVTNRGQIQLAKLWISIDSPSYCIMNFFNFGILNFT